MIACLYGPQRTHVVTPPAPLKTPLWSSPSSSSSTTTTIVTTKPKRKPLPDGVELTLSELQDMASRQQQQIESHQQLLIAKEQRVKFLKQQEYRHQEIAAENERLRWLRDRVQAQEMKLQKLRALRGQVDQQKINNSSLTSELESIRSLFNAKEKELSVAVAKVEQLTMQLEELRRGRINGVGGGRQNFPAAIELEKLRQELLYRNKLNEQQNNKLVQQREVLNQRTEEMGRIDRRIAELQQRLQRKRLLNQQLASQINAATSAKQAQLRANQKKCRVSEHGSGGGGGVGGVRTAGVFGSNIAAVEPYQHLPNEGNGIVQQDRVQDDLHTKLNSGTSGTIGEELSIFHPNKNDPKYQTLPYNTKFSTKYGAKSGGSGSSGGEVSGGDSDESKNGHSSGSDATNGNKRQEEKLPVMSQVSPSVGGPSNTGQNGRSLQQLTQQQQQQLKGLPLGVPSQTVHSIPTYAPAKAHATPVPQGATEILPPPPQPTISKATSQPISSYAVTRHYGSAYSNGPSTRAQLMETTGGNGTKMAAPPYIPPPASTMHKANSGHHHHPHSSMDMIQKPISAIQPSTVHHVKAPVQSISVSHSLPNRPATTYQTAATRFVPLAPQMTQGEVTESESPPQVVVNFTSNQQGNSSSTAGESNRNGQQPTVRGGNGDTFEVSSSSDGGIGSSSDTSSSNIPKPALPPKPCIPQKPTPPPRQIHNMIEKSRAAARLDTSPEAIDSALSVLHSSAQQAGSGHRYASKSVIANTYTRKVTNGVFDQYLKNVNQFYGKGDVDGGVGGGGDDTEGHSELDAQNRHQDSSISSSPQKKTNPNELPIKAKPLTIKKQTGLEPPKLRGGLASSSLSSMAAGTRKGAGDVPQNTRPTMTQSNAAQSYHVSLNRRIEIPPAFLFPEGESPPSDLGNSPSTQMPMTNGPLLPCNDVLDQASSKYNGPNDRIVSVVPNNTLAQEDLITTTNGNMNTNRAVERDKRRPLMDCIGSDDHLHQSLLDNNANSNSSNERGDDGQAITHGSDEQNTNQTHSKLEDGCERHGPVGGTLEENNNLIEVTVRDDNSTNNVFIDQLANNDNGILSPESNLVQQQLTIAGESVSRRVKKTNLKSKNSTKQTRRVSFDPLALLLDAALEGELELVRKTAQEVPNPSAANDEGITALHNAICAGHYEIVKFLVEFGCDVNAQDSDGWTPLHCAASCNNLPMVKFLVEHGACIFATTLSDHETAAEKCEEDEEGFDGCTEYLYSNRAPRSHLTLEKEILNPCFLNHVKTGIQEKLGILNNGVVYALYDYDAQSTDELCFKDRDVIVVLRKGDEFEREWWWSKVKDREGYIPRNLLGVSPPPPFSLYSEPRQPIILCFSRATTKKKFKLC